MSIKRFISAVVELIVGSHGRHLSITSVVMQADAELASPGTAPAPNPNLPIEGRTMDEWQDLLGVLPATIAGARQLDPPKGELIRKLEELQGRAQTITGQFPIVEAAPKRLELEAASSV